MHPNPFNITNLEVFNATVYRVNWLRAKARHARWQEEKVLILAEMQNTIRWFEHRKRTWEGRVQSASQTSKGGHAAYGRKQVFLSQQFIDKAKQSFANAISTT